MMTPLDCIIAFSTSLVNTALSKEHLDKSNIICKTAGLLKLHMKDMLDRKLIEKGKLELSFEVIDLY